MKKKNSWWTKAAVVIFTNGGKQSNFIEIVLRHGCSPENLLHIFRAPFPANTSGWLPLYQKQTIKLKIY